jgi:hypothetical protein
MTMERGVREGERDIKVNIIKNYTLQEIHDYLL